MPRARRAGMHVERVDVAVAPARRDPRRSGRSRPPIRPALGDHRVRRHRGDEPRRASRPPSRLVERLEDRRRRRRPGRRRARPRRTPRRAPRRRPRRSLPAATGSAGRAAGAPLEVLPEAEAVAAVERAHVLDRPAARVGREPGELEQRRAGAQPSSFASRAPGDDGLDRLLGRVELDAVVGVEQLVEGDVVAERGGDPVEPLGVQEQHLDRDRLAVGEAQALDPQHLARPGRGGAPSRPRCPASIRLTVISFEPGTIPRARISSVWLVEAERAPRSSRARRTCPCPGGGRSAARPRGRCEHVADGRAGDAELGAELALGRQGGAFRERRGSARAGPRAAGPT